MRRPCRSSTVLISLLNQPPGSGAVTWQGRSLTFSGVGLLDDLHAAAFPHPAGEQVRAGAEGHGARQRGNRDRATPVTDEVPARRDSPRADLVQHFQRRDKVARAVDAQFHLAMRGNVDVLRQNFRALTEERHVLGEGAGYVERLGLHEAGSGNGESCSQCRNSFQVVSSQMGPPGVSSPGRTDLIRPPKRALASQVFLAPLDFVRGARQTAITDQR